MQHERVTPFAGLGRRAAAASFVAFLAGALPLAAQQKSDAAIKSDIELARGLAADWQYVDLAEGVIEDLESGSLPDELASEVALVKCEIYAVGARRESDADRREELYTKAIDAYRDFIDKNPLSDVLPEAQRGYVDVCNQAALKMADRLPEATGEEAEELRREINGVLVAKLADFGTARFVPELLGHGANPHHSTEMVIGTKPYMPPEYTMMGRVSEKTDTFAFGVVLCELLTGLPAADYDKGEWLATTMPEPLADAERLLPPLLDTRLGVDDGGADGAWPLERAVALGRIAGRCIKPRAADRSAVSELLPEIDALALREAQQC